MSENRGHLAVCLRVLCEQSLPRGGGLPCGGTQCHSGALLLKASLLGVEPVSEPMWAGTPLRALPRPGRLTGAGSALQGAGPAPKPGSLITAGVQDLLYEKLS